MFVIAAAKRLNQNRYFLGNPWLQLCFINKKFQNSIFFKTLFFNCFLNSTGNTGQFQNIVFFQKIYGDLNYCKDQRRCSSCLLTVMFHGTPFIITSIDTTRIIKPCLRFQVLSQKIFSKWQLLKGIFPSGNCPNMQIPKWQLSKSVPAAALGPKPKQSQRSAHSQSQTQRYAPSHCSRGRLRGPNLTFGKLPIGKLSLGVYLTPCLIRHINLYKRL